MRKLILVLAATLAAAFAPTAASAQSLQDVLGVVQAGSAYGYNSCSYVNSGFGKVACQANRASTVANTLVDIKRRRDNERREKFDRRTQQLVALQRACASGDRQSCVRSGGSDPRQMEVARALMDACTAGDRNSCARAESMMDERNIVASYQPSAYSQEQAQASLPPYHPNYRAASATQGATAQQNCVPMTDPKTGYRIAGQYRCK